MDISRALLYFKDDAEWVKKILIGAVISLVPILSFAASGYGLEQTKRVYNGAELPLPEWDQLGEYFKKGLMVFVAGMIYSIPMILIMCCTFLPATFLSGGTSGSSSSGDMSPIGMVLMLCGSCLVFLYAIVLLVFMPVLMTRYALTDQFNVFFQIGEAWKIISANTGTYGMVIVGLLVAGLVASLVSSVTCGLGGLVTGIWTTVVMAHLLGNFARTAMPGLGGAPQYPAPMR